MKRLITICAVTLLFAGAASAQEIANFSRGQQVVSPEVYDGGSVTFRLAADYATTVYLSGNWMAQGEGPVAMTKGPGGVWETTVSGLEQLSPDKHYLFVSNHRDIMLDASLLQYWLVKNGFETTEITFGENLMRHPVVIDVGRSNKMFKVARPGGDIKEFYRQSLHLSEYIRYTIREKGESVWIAQRNGRTKNGIDRTDQGIIKMFCMSEDKDRVKALAELNIVPVAISYEWESCDVLKALELYESQYTKYTKKPGEDLNSIMTGIVQWKGRVHMALCEPIHAEELAAMEGLTNNEYHKAVAGLIDQRINGAYRLWPNNYVAHDILYGNERYRAIYTNEEREAFRHHLAKLDRYAETCDIERLQEIFLGIYANPVDNR